MSVFLLPKSITSKLNGLYRKFWWGYSETSKKIQWINWGKMGVSKAKGGLEFRDTQDFSLALLAKQCWRFFQNPPSMVSQVFKHKYFPLQDFLHAKLGHCTSFAWWSLLVGRKLLHVRLIWGIRDGCKVKIWKAKCITSPLSNKIFSPPQILNEEALISELIDERKINARI